MKVKSIELSEASNPLSEYVPGAGEEPLIITRNGKPVAAIVPMENTDLETAALATNPQFLAIIDRSRRRKQKEGGISAEEMRHRLHGRQ